MKPDQARVELIAANQRLDEAERNDRYRDGSVLQEARKAVTGATAELLIADILAFDPSPR